jgi:hypothetical protein
VVQGGSNVAAGVREGDILAGKYRVERVLGAGGTGVVVAAHHIQIDEKIALKILGVLRRRFRFAAPIAAAITLVGSAPARADVTKDQCIDANGKGQELRREGKLTAAREQLRLCANPSCPAMVRDDCTKRFDDLERAQPTIAFEAKDPAGSDLSAVKVTVDGLPLTDRLTGTPVSVDPGEHTFMFEAPGQPMLQKKLIIHESEKDRREFVVLGTPDTGAATGAGTQPPSFPSPSPTTSGLGTQKVLAIVAGGIGVVGIGLGSAFGLMTISKKNDARSVCPNLCMNQDGVNRWSDAGSTGNISTIAFIVGGVGLAGGAVLWFTAPSLGGSAGAQVGFGPGALQVKGTW